MKRQVWTWGLFSAENKVMCNFPITTKVDVIEEQEIGKGYKAFSFKTPKGILIAEFIIGAIIGEDWNEVKADIIHTPKSVIKKQIKLSQQELNRGSKSYFLNQFITLHEQQIEHSQTERN